VTTASKKMFDWVIRTELTIRLREENSENDSDYAVQNILTGRLLYKNMNFKIYTNMQNQLFCMSVKHCLGENNDWMKMIAIWDIPPCSLEVDRRFTGVYCLTSKIKSVLFICYVVRVKLCVDST
jgi:hypothetical protein